MQPLATERPARIVMLVDNGVNGDSRVQKVARAAADLGWDVTLLGIAPHGAEKRWTLGEAKVRLLRMPKVLAKGRHEFHRAMFRWPLAYPPTGIAEKRALVAQARHADLDIREAQLKLAGVPAGAMAWKVLRARRLATRAFGKWVWLRHKMLQRSRSGRKYRAPWDYAYSWFWQAVLRERAWRKLDPGLWDFELAYGKVIDELKPDLIHANDFRMIGVGARAVIRARAAGRDTKLVWDAHEFLPGVKPWHGNARWRPANMAHEREFAPYADAVMTVSDTLAEMLRDSHHLAELPTVVLNAPAMDHGPEGDDSPPRDLRADCGIGPDVPLMVYSGAAAEQRGLRTMVQALPELPGVHVAFVVGKPQDRYVQSLVRDAKSLGVADRVHLVTYVPHWQVVPYLAGADIGVIPIHHWPNHEIALITKFFEYSHARLPLVVSDVRTMAATVESTKQGEVFRAEDVPDFVRAVKAVLADKARYQAVYDTPGLLQGWTWDAQVATLEKLYRRLLGDVTNPEFGA